MLLFSNIFVTLILTTQSNISLKKVWNNLRICPLYFKNLGLLSMTLLQVTITALRTECYSWDIATKMWTGKYCRKPRILVGYRLACLCSTPLDDDPYYSPLADKVKSYSSNHSYSRWFNTLRQFKIM